MLAEIKRIVNEEVSSRINQYDVIHEALTNSIHANATKIICVLDSFENPLQDSGKDIVYYKLDTIQVWDNGEGFNNENYDSFCKYRSEHKKRLGCKGVGRFIFLKVYKNAIYKSFLLKEQKKCSFKFDFDFDTDNRKLEDFKVKSNSTIVSLSDLTSSYINNKKNFDRRIDLNIDYIR